MEWQIAGIYEKKQMKFGGVITVTIPVYFYRLAHYSVRIKAMVGKVIISAAYLRIAFSLGW